MTVERHFEKMQQMYDSLSKEAKETAVQVGDNHYMSLQGLLDENREAYSNLNDGQKANIHVDPTGIMASSGDPEKAIACVVGAAGFMSR